MHSSIKYINLVLTYQSPLLIQLPQNVKPYEKLKITPHHSV